MTATNADRPRFIVTGRTVLACMLGFFGVIFAVNGVFLYFAIDTWPGLANDRAYVEGLDYNRVLEAAAEQRALGWTSTVTYRDGEAGSIVAVSLAGPDGEPLSSRRPTISLLRPLGAGEPVDLAAHEASPGVYETVVPALEPGRWRVTVRVGDLYIINHELWVTP